MNIHSTQQQAAIDAEGNVMLLACPGSGKTRVLTYRIIRELEKNQKKTVLGITFTNVAADELTSRVINNLGTDERLWTSTIHSFCNEWIIKPYKGYHCELKKGYTIGEEYVCNNIINDLKSKYKLPYYELINTRLMKDGSFYEKDLVKRKLLTEYHIELKKRKIIDFDLIIYYAYELLSNNNFICNNVGKLFSLMCIDEFQDTFDLQYAIISLIYKENKESMHIFFVGDLDQAIYNNLGAIQLNTNELEELFDTNFVYLTLNGNYRSHQQIIDFYSSFQVTPLTILGENKEINDEEPIITYDKLNISKDDVIDKISKYIEYGISKGYKDNEICVIAPFWFLLSPIEKELKNRFPNNKFNSALSVSILRKSGEFSLWYKIVKLKLMPKKGNYYLYRMKLGKELIENIEGKIGYNLDITSKRILKLINSINIDEVYGIEYMLSLINLFFGKLGIIIDDFEALAEGLNIFINDVQSKEERIMKENNEVDKIKVDIIRNMFHEKEGIKISTIHGVKGEEFKSVIAFGLLEGKVPFGFNAHPNEAKKLLYVLSSRAEINLHLISEVWTTQKPGKRPYTFSPTNVLRCLTYSYDNIL